MNENYLWDKTGEPDPEVEKLERLLGTLRHDRPLRMREPQIPWKRFAAAAAVVLVVCSSAWVLTRGPKEGWEVAIMQGNENRRTVLSVGEVLQTDSTSRAKIDVVRMGTLDVEPDTRLKLVRSRNNEHRVALQRGTIHAFITAPARNFFVDTPSAVAVDLGCKYTLHVDEHGTGLLKVELGWVSFESNGRESFIPAGAACWTRPKSGAGIPYYLDATDRFRTALKSFEETGNTADLAVVLAEARREDAFTLWHILPRTNGAEREQVFTRMAAIVPPPSDVTGSGILALDRKMMDHWWDTLGLNDTNWWRMWKRPLPQ